jgi:hypothetical protein
MAGWQDSSARCQACRSPSHPAHRHAGAPSPALKMAERAIWDWLGIGLCEVAILTGVAALALAGARTERTDAPVRAPQ